MKVADEQLETLLKAWGICYFERPRTEDYQRRSRLAHPIAQSMQFGAKKKVTRTTEWLKRAGYDRRRIMGVAAGIPMVAAAFVDPVPCKQSRKGKGGGHGSGRPVHPDIQRVEQAVKDLEGVNFVRALCLRMKFCTEGLDADKAAAATERLREITRDPGRKGISVDTFRDEVMFGRLWVQAIVTSAQAALSRTG